jgi:hypothetical protein
MFVWGFNEVSFEISTDLGRTFDFRPNPSGINIWHSKRDQKKKKKIFFFASVRKIEMFIRRFKGFNEASFENEIRFLLSE